MLDLTAMKERREHHVFPKVKHGGNITIKGHVVTVIVCSDGHRVYMKRGLYRIRN